MAEYLRQYQELANDIAAATFRVAELVKEPRLRSELQSALFDLILSNTANTAKLKSLIKFGQSIKEIKDINADILSKELGHLEILAKEVNSANADLNLMAEFKNKKYGSELGQLSKWSSPDIKRPSGRVMDSLASQRFGRQANLEQVLRFVETRQETRFKDLEQAFGLWSSRTLRRIIERLRKSGKIERVGNPGPSSFYRASGSISGIGEQPVASEKIEITADDLSRQRPAGEADLSRREPTAEAEKPESSNPETIIAL